MNLTAQSDRQTSADAISAFLTQASIEATAKDAKTLSGVASPDQLSAVFVPWLPNNTFEPRLDAVKTLREAGFEPVPHVCARRVTSKEKLHENLSRYAEEAAVSRILLIGGDPETPLGPYADCASIIRSTDLAQYGITKVSLAGHPEGHPNMSGDQPTDVLLDKIAGLTDQGIESEVATQFSFDPDLVGGWIKHLRARGVDSTIAIGIPGPAKISTLLKFSARCGVGASSKAVAKYGFSLTRLLGNAGPDKFVQRLAEVTSGDDRLRPHFYPFGGFADTLRWLEEQSQ